MKPGCCALPLLAVLACEVPSPGVPGRPDQFASTRELNAPQLCAIVRLAPGVLSTEADEGRLTATPDGQTVYFHRLDDRQVLTIMQSQRSGAGWSTPVVAPFSGTHDDLDPFVSADGSQLWFSSFRPVEGGSPRPDAEIWLVVRSASGWSEPIHLGPAINSPYHELFPSTTADGTLYFNSNRAAPSPAVWDGWDIYSSRRQGDGYHPASRLDSGINTEAFWEFNPTPSSDGRLLLFASLGRPDGLGGADLYASLRWAGRWLPARNLGACINSAAEEYHPMLIPGRSSFVFVRAFDPALGGDFHELALPGIWP
jgi:hypothetical protein